MALHKKLISLFNPPGENSKQRNKPMKEQLAGSHKQEVTFGQVVIKTDIIQLRSFDLQMKDVEEFFFFSTQLFAFSPRFVNNNLGHSIKHSCWFLSVGSIEPSSHKQCKTSAWWEFGRMLLRWKITSSSSLAAASQESIVQVQTSFSHDCLEKRLQWRDMTSWQSASFEGKRGGTHG